MRMTFWINCVMQASIVLVVVLVLMGVEAWVSSFSHSCLSFSHCYCYSTIYCGWARCLLWSATQSVLYFWRPDESRVCFTVERGSTSSAAVLLARQMMQSIYS